MADAVSKTTPTKGVIHSINTPDYPTNDYFIDPVLPSSDKRYWKNDSGALAEMTQAEKDVVDAVIAEENQRQAVLIDIRKGERALAFWVANNDIDDFTTLNKKNINKKLEDVYNSLNVGALSAASDLLENDINASGELTQALIDDLKDEIDDQI